MRDLVNAQLKRFEDDHSADAQRKRQSLMTCPSEKLQNALAQNESDTAQANEDAARKREADEAARLLAPPTEVVISQWGIMVGPWNVVGKCPAGYEPPPGPRKLGILIYTTCVDPQQAKANFQDAIREAAKSSIPNADPRDSRYRRESGLEL
jgi:hypothetical protein